MPPLYTASGLGEVEDHLSDRYMFSDLHAGAYSGGDVSNGAGAPLASDIGTCDKTVARTTTPGRIKRSGTGVHDVGDGDGDDGTMGPTTVGGAAVERVARVSSES